MSIVYAAKSATMIKWAKDVGLGQHLYKVGVAADADALAQAVKDGWCQVTDWTVVAKAEAGDLVEEEAIERLKKREKMVDPAIYPRLKGQAGLFKVKAQNVENHIMVTQALAGMDTKLVKLKPADIGTYLIGNAQR